MTSFTQVANRSAVICRGQSLTVTRILLHSRPQFCCTVPSPGAARPPPALKPSSLVPRRLHELRSDFPSAAWRLGNALLQCCSSSFSANIYHPGMVCKKVKYNANSGVKHTFLKYFLKKSNGMHWDIKLEVGGINQECLVAGGVYRSNGNSTAHSSS